MTAAQVVERLETAGIANARLNTMQEFWNHPQLEARDRWREVGTEAGAVRAAKVPLNLSEFEPRMDDIPALGAHSRALLAELGYAAAEIDTLAAAGAIRSS
jgi:crotonobetainyl-CoA:carnitine CoA-transferase CaiB-like acyl-CoA transferase